MKDIQMVVAFKNNLILSHMKTAGIKTAADLSRQSGISQCELGGFLNMTLLPMTKDFRWRVPALRLANFFKCLPEDLFSNFQQCHVLENNRAATELEWAKIQQLLQDEQGDPLKFVESNELSNIINGFLNSLSESEMSVLTQYFGLGCDSKSLTEISRSQNESVNTIQATIQRALRYLRNPVRSRILRDFIE